MFTEENILFDLIRYKLRFMRTLARKDAYIILQLKPKCLKHCLTFRKENLDFTTFLNLSQGRSFIIQGGGAPRYLTLVSGDIIILKRGIGA